MDWRRPAVADRVVLVVDDIFDEGDTLKAILAGVRRLATTGGGSTR